METNAKPQLWAKEGDVDSIDSEPSASIRESDYRHRQTVSGLTLLWLAYQATGVIYGDIGTSPLYVFSSTFSSNPSPDDVLGAVSLIIWTLTLVVSIKYAWIVLFADDEGEGGIFAVYTLLTRYCHVAKRGQAEARLVKMERYATDQLPKENRGLRRFLENSKVAHATLKILAVAGVSLLLADGVLTPAQSVLGAIQGLEVVAPNITNATIVGVSCAILVILFVLQPLGIHRISSVWAPIVIVWLVFNAAFGIYNLAHHDYTILKAFSPYFAGAWFVRNGTSGWEQLGGILLAITGVETLFADMGAFNRSAIRISWFSFAYPCLCLAYLGQGAYLLDDPTVYVNPFFLTVPPGMLYPSLVFAILAAVVASQATITGCFQLLTQIMSASYFPQLQLKHTSDTFHGQVYVPLANWLLMIGCVIVTAVYNNTVSIGNAYGTCVILVTFITTHLVALAAMIVWRLSPLIVLPIWLVFSLFDGLYLSSALTKVPSGAWFTLMLAAALALFFSLWRYGKETQWAGEAESVSPLSSILVKTSDGQSVAFTQNFGSSQLGSIDGFGIFFDKTGTLTPEVYLQWLLKLHCQPKVSVLLHMRALSVPRVAEEERIECIRTGIPHVYRLLVRHGYQQSVVNPGLAKLAYDEIRKALASGDITREPGKRDAESSSTTIASRLQVLDQAFAAPPLYVTGKQRLRLKKEHNILTKLVLNIFLWVRENTGSKIQRWNVPVENLVEVGFVKEM